MSIPALAHEAMTRFRARIAANGSPPVTATDGSAMLANSPTSRSRSASLSVTPSRMDMAPMPHEGQESLHRVVSSNSTRRGRYAAAVRESPARANPASTWSNTSAVLTAYLPMYGTTSPRPATNSPVPSLIICASWKRVLSAGPPRAWTAGGIPLLTSPNMAYAGRHHHRRGISQAPVSRADPGARETGARFGQGAPRRDHQM